MFFLSGRKTGWTFLGATDVIEDGKWMWADGSAFEFTNWASHEPNGGTDENCLEMDGSYQADWNDTPCSYENVDAKSYVCAYDAGKQRC